MSEADGPASSRRRLPWYAEGLRFECTGCGDCCGGVPGAVWLNDAELARLADALGLSEEQFTARHVRQLADRRSLRERANGDCILLDTESRSCTVYQARPTQCRSWPFWPQNVAPPAAWQKTCELCPGAGQGPNYRFADIDDQLVATVQARRG